MFSTNDKLNLAIINARNIKGEIIPFYLNLSKDEEYNIPNDLAALDVFEYQEGTVNNGSIAFSIFIGESSTIENLIPNMKDVRFKKDLILPSVETVVCYQTISGLKQVFAVLNNNDITVNNKEELQVVIENIKDELSSIHSSVNKVQTTRTRK